MDAANWPHGFGFCWCGCGVRTPIATKTRRGNFRGKPIRYIHGHNTSVAATPIEDRFWPKVAISAKDDCWEWQGGKQHDYGITSFAGGKPVASHRAAWILTYGEIKDGLCVCHKCDNPLCCNPSHLFLGTRDDNNKDRDSKERRTPPRGGAHSRAKVTEQQICQIRERAANGETGTILAKEFGISASSMSAIITRKTWTHVFK